MTTILTTMYLVVMGLFLIASVMIVYHIWVYYFNRFLAIFTIAIFLVVDFILFSASFRLFAGIDFSSFNLFF